LKEKTDGKLKAAQDWRRTSKNKPANFEAPNSVVDVKEHKRTPWAWDKSIKMREEKQALIYGRWNDGKKEAERAGGVKYKAYYAERKDTSR
jgi:hypothetical protein